MISASMNGTKPQRRVAVVLALFLVAIAATLVPFATAAPDDVEQRVEAILSKMTLDQKIDMLGGEDDFYIRAYPDLGLPRLRMADGPIGVRHGGPATTMAGGIRWPRHGIPRSPPKRARKLPATPARRACTSCSGRPSTSTARR